MGVGAWAECRDWSWISTAERGSIEIPRVIVGDWSVIEVGWDFPLRAKMAEGLALERLPEVSLVKLVEGYPPRSWKGFPGHW
jgi:hypothetical protein